MWARLREVSFLLFCALGVFFSYLFYGILQEKITKSRYGVQRDEFKYFFSMLFFQCVVNSVFAGLAQKVWNEPRGLVSESKFALCGFTYIGAMFASNYSLKFVSYPTQVISKSVKPIPVMFLNVLLAKRNYPLRKYLFVIMISAGVVLFMYKNKASNNPTVFGFGEFLLVISLLLDGLTGGVQESLSKYKIGPYTLMLHMNLWSLLYLASALMATGEVFLFVQFVHRHPVILTSMTLFGLTSAVGQIFLFTLLTNFGSLMCAIVTTTRKFFTVLASIILFSHAMSTSQWIGTLLVFAGIFFDQFYGKAPQKLHKCKAKNDCAYQEVDLLKNDENKLKSP
ncbi:putative UDP-Glc/Gal endoplasmic reticulum nucleotide sugar transporter variant 1 [Paragonimus heterotremus]|uniref:Putative UDP-Glc/Gal endoplasmic reticulum nucleotide sugar transporter variant 1 n=1 Tax=Paragonimus heterotremus TaxID=100268 RepID=A0A8J4TF86_9TREM|nr:putative UDP-Glc/Gal endoplasmic reticulum nucleotide sugar transporter variant 1 [Paragonimus heterotremus]